MYIANLLYARYMKTINYYNLYFLIHFLVVENYYSNTSICNYLQFGVVSVLVLSIGNLEVKLLVNIFI